MGRWIAALVVMLLVAIFALQNARPVPVHLLFWTAPRVSLSVLILLGALLGALVGWVAAVLDGRRRSGGRGLDVPVPVAAPSEPTEREAPAPDESAAPPES